MATLTKTAAKGKGKVQRSLRIGAAVDGVRGLVITDSKGERCGYSLREIPVDFGRGFQLDKFEMEQAAADDRTYHVHLDAELGDSCTCKGFIYRSKCKHVDAVKTLVALGKV
jgi:SWIM zinc finger